MIQNGFAVGALGTPYLSPNPAITLLAVFFGIIWTVSNFYLFYPLNQTAVQALVERLRSKPQEPATASTDGGTPTIDVLLPAYDEASVVEQSVRSVLEAEYPADSLRLTVLLEPDDTATREVVSELADNLEFDLEIVPEGYPGDPNKPRALNWGFEHTDGDIVGVIDAEDIVPMSLFREVAGTITGSVKFAQGRLDMVNEEDGLLNLLFRAEYGYWYNLVLPSFAATDYPIPIAGTTCFFDRATLESASTARLDQRGDPWTDGQWGWTADHGLDGVRPWDPQNVTEDFELGLFLWELEYDFAYLDSVTREESPQSLDGWIDQRTRWKKGKLYTFFDRKEHPPRTRRKKAHLYWQSALPHLGPVNVAGLVVLVLISNLAEYRPSALLNVVLSLGVTFTVVTGVLFGVGYLSASDAPRYTQLRRSVLTVVTVPLYWLLQWGADIRALVRLYAGNLAWEHTDHFGVEEREESSEVQGRRTDRFTLSLRERVGALALIVVVAGLLRVFLLGGWSLWTDEIYSVAVRGDLPVADLLVLPTDPHPPLYYLLLHYWMELFGDGQLAVRSLSVLMGVGTVLAVYLLGTELFDDRTGLLAALMVGTSPFFIHFSRVTRMYSLLTLLTALSWYWYTRLRDRTTTSAVGYVLVTTLLVYTHVYGLFVLLGQHIYTALSEVNGGIPSRRWFGATAGVGVLTAPWAGLFLLRIFNILFGTAGGNIEWIPEPSSVLLTQTALSFVGFPDFYPLTAGNLVTYLLASVLLFAFIAQLISSVVRFEDGEITLEDAGSVGQMATLVLAPTLVPLVISLLVPIYVPRYAAPASVGFIVLAARGLRNVPTKRIRFGLLAVILLSSLVFTGAYYTVDSVEPWSQASNGINVDAGPDDVVIHQPDSGYADYYYSDTDIMTATLPSSGGVTREDLLYAENLSTRQGTVYLVQYYGANGPAVRYLGACHERTTRQRLGVITVHRFDGEADCPPTATAFNGTADT